MRNRILLVLGLLIASVAVAATLVNTTTTCVGVSCKVSLAPGNNSTGAATTALTADASSGTARVGVGTTSPATALDVVGTVASTAGVTVNGNGSTLRLFGSSTDANNAEIGFSNESNVFGSGAGGIYAQGTSGTRRISFFGGSGSTEYGSLYTTTGAWHLGGNSGVINVESGPRHGTISSDNFFNLAGIAASNTLALSPGSNNMIFCANQNSGASILAFIGVFAAHHVLISQSVAGAWAVGSGGTDTTLSYNGSGTVTITRQAGGTNTYQCLVLGTGN